MSVTLQQHLEHCQLDKMFFALLLLLSCMMSVFVCSCGDWSSQWPHELADTLVNAPSVEVFVFRRAEKRQVRVTAGTNNMNVLKIVLISPSWEGIHDNYGYFQALTTRTSPGSIDTQ